MGLQQIDLGKVQGDGIPQGGQPGQGIMIDDDGQIVWTTLTAESIEWNKVLNTPAYYPPDEHNHSVADITDLANNYATKKHTHTTADISNVSSLATASALATVQSQVNTVQTTANTNKNNINKTLEAAGMVVRYNWTNKKIIGGQLNTLTQALAIKTGYTPVGVVGYNTGGALRAVVNIYISNNVINFIIMNNGATETNTLYADVLYLKNKITL